MNRPSAQSDILNRQIKQTYDDRGFVVVRQLLLPAGFAQLARELDRYIRDVVPSLPAESAFYDDRARPATLKQLQHLTGDPFFRDYVHHPAWVELAGLLIGTPVRCRGPEWFNKPPGSSRPTPPHQDNYYFNLTPPEVVTIWLALDAVDATNGALHYLAGSHRSGLRPHGASRVLGFSQSITNFSDAEAAGGSAVSLAAGDAVCHHGLAVHWADANRSGRPRRAFAMVFESIDCRRDEPAYARYLDALARQHRELGIREES